MLNNLSSEQFGRTTANTNQRDNNGQGSTSSSNTTTVIAVKGAAPTISTRSS